LLTVTAQLSNTQCHDATIHMIRQCIWRDIAGEPTEGGLISASNIIFIFDW
jgi:hypothetical protein